MRTINRHLMQACRRIALMIVVMTFVGNGSVTLAQGDGMGGSGRTDASAPGAGTPGPGGPAATQPSADQVQKQMLELVAPNPALHSTVPTVTDPGGSPLVAPSARPEVIGVAPDDPQPQLRREGEFIVNRRGRLMMSSQSGQMLYVFEADSAQSPETPMPIVPCQVLQNMEDLLRDRKGNLVFVISGQVLLYRGGNYLLPTMMKIAIDRGNLQP